MIEETSCTQMSRLDTAIKGMVTLTGRSREPNAIAHPAPPPARCKVVQAKFRVALVLVACLLLQCIGAPPALAEDGMGFGFVISPSSAIRPSAFARMRHSW